MTARRHASGRASGIVRQARIVRRVTFGVTRRGRYVEAVLNVTIVRILTAVFVLASVASTYPLAAQSLDERVAYQVLIETPTAGLPPVLSNAMLDLPMRAPDVAVRLGHISMNRVGVNMIGATLGIPAGRQATIGFTAGYQGCGGGPCDAHPVAGARAEGRLGSSLLGTGVDAFRLTVGLNGEIGFGHSSGSSLVSLSGGVPVALVAGGPTLKIAPFLTPALGWGRMSAGGSLSATRLMLGGGVTVMSTTTGISANFGFQKVFIDGGNTMFGVNLVFGFR
jgi:hypothetical protein